MVVDIKCGGTGRNSGAVPWISLDLGLDLTLMKELISNKPNTNNNFILTQL
jgi:hypothetical protein